MPGKPVENNAQLLTGIEKLIHEPARLMILATLHAVESADFLFVEHHTGLSRGNLSSHLSKLESAGYITIKKEFVGKIPRTLLRITPDGRNALLAYVGQMQQIIDNVKNRA